VEFVKEIVDRNRFDDDGDNEGRKNKSHEEPLPWKSSPDETKGGEDPENRRENGDAKGHSETSQGRTDPLRVCKITGIPFQREPFRRKLNNPFGAKGHGDNDQNGHEEKEEDEATGDA
jgi:hypothetical protein